MRKTKNLSDGTIVLGQTVEMHCLATGYVTRYLKIFMNDKKRALYPVGCALVSACHDVGKVNPTFQKELRQHTTGYSYYSTPSLTDPKTADPELQKTFGYHSNYSKWTFRVLRQNKKLGFPSFSTNVESFDD